jgi:hypothetical protein
MTEHACDAEISHSDALICPLTGRATLSVERRTVLGHVRESISPTASFGFCDVPACSVVYVGSEGRLIDKDDVRTRVGLKETSEPVAVCYCFDYTERQIIEDVRAHGRSTIREFIAKQVQAGLCRCAVTNPSGRCCLGNVMHAVAKARSSDEA